MRGSHPLSRTPPVPEAPCRSRFAQGLLVACLASLLVACGGGGASLTPPETASRADYAPLDPGDRWVYRRQDGALEQRAVVGTRTVSGRIATVVATTDLTLDEVEVSFFVKTATALIELPDSADPIGQQVGEVTTLLLPPKQGQSFVQVDKTVTQGFDVDGDGRPDAFSIRSEVTVLGFESVQVAAGPFADCAHLRTVASVDITLSSTGARLSTVDTVDEWVSPTLGLVRDNVVTEAAGQRSTTTRELVAYAVGGVRSDTRPPALTFSRPAAGSTSRVDEPLLLRFDKAVDLATFRNGGLTLLDAAGQSVPTLLSQNNSGTEISARPLVPLGTGRYTVKLGPGVHDLIGNDLPSQDWFFTVDQAGPSLLSAVPAFNAVDVPLNTTIRLQFGEPLDPSTVVPGNIVLSSSALGEVPIRLEMPDARSVLITPLQPLAAGRRYSVVLAPSLADALGNPLFNALQATAFDTTQGRFSSPVTLAGAGGRGLASGDANGDGRSDLLTIVDNPSSEAATFNLFLQRAGGGFELPRQVEVAARAGCGGAGIALLVDMNGDGRADIVATRGSCGVEVFYQGAGGAFDRSTLLEGGGFTMLKVLDMNGDGRPDVVATAWGSESVSVWLQRSDGSRRPRAGFALFNNGYGDLAVGDLNGDGRHDIAVVSGQGDLDAALGIIYQQADGSFGTPSYRALSGTVGPSTLTIADLDGDGRADLLTHSPGVGYLWWFRQRPDGTLAPPVSLGGAGDAWQLAVVDVDGDGRRDLLIGTGDYDLFLGLQLQRADGSFAAPVAFRGASAILGANAMAVADFDGDGRPDVAMNGPVLLRNLGDAPPRSSPPLPPAMSPPAAPAPLSCRSVRCRPLPAAAARWR